MDHGLPFDHPVLIKWGAGLPVAFCALVGLFRALDLWPEPARKGTRRSDIMAFQIVALFCVTYLAMAGFYIYSGAEGIYDHLLTDKFYAESKFVKEHLVLPMISYQFWNTVLCFVFNDLNDLYMVGHHVVTGSLGYFGLAPYLHFSGIFYFGIAEFTNIPLTFYDIFKYFPEYKTTFPAIYEGSRVIFALTFVALRLVVWPIVSYPFWVGSIELVQSGKAHSNTVVLTFLVANSFLTGLQFLWGSKIVSVLMSALSPSKSKKKA